MMLFPATAGYQLNILPTLSFPAAGSPPTPARSLATPAHRRAVLLLRAERQSATGGTFLAAVRLGEGDGTVTHEFRPYFSSSTLITMRYPVPYTLEAEPQQGVIKVTETGDGLIEGDVLRAFSTLEMRYDSLSGQRRYFDGLEGILGEAADEDERKRSWQGWAEGIGRALGVFNPEAKPRRCLFVSEGQPYQQVIDALVANTPEKTREIVMVFERPLSDLAGRLAPS